MDDLLTELAPRVARSRGCHRGNILLTLEQCGHKLAQDAAYAIWDWEKM
jgi:hypothetical protein